MNRLPFTVSRTRPDQTVHILLRLQLKDGSPDGEATVRHMTATLPCRGNLTIDEALQQSVGELGKGQRCRFCLVHTFLTCTR